MTSAPLCRVVDGLLLAEVVAVAVGVDSPVLVEHAARPRVAVNANAAMVGLRILLTVF